MSDTVFTYYPPVSAYDGTIDKLAAAISRARSRWLNRQMKKLLPNDIYCAARTPDRQHLVTDYCNQHKISFRDSPLSFQITKDDKVIAEWTVYRPELSPILRPDQSIEITDKDKPKRTPQKIIITD